MRRVSTWVCAWLAVSCADGGLPAGIVLETSEPNDASEDAQDLGVLEPAQRIHVEGRLDAREDDPADERDIYRVEASEPLIAYVRLALERGQDYDLEVETARRTAFSVGIESRELVELPLGQGERIYVAVVGVAGHGRYTLTLDAEPRSARPEPLSEPLHLGTLARNSTGLCASQGHLASVDEFDLYTVRAAHDLNVAVRLYPSGANDTDFDLRVVTSNATVERASTPPGGDQWGERVELLVAAGELITIRVDRPGGAGDGRYELCVDAYTPS